MFVKFGKVSDRIEEFYNLPIIFDKTNLANM